MEHYFGDSKDANSSFFKEKTNIQQAIERIKILSKIMTSPSLHYIYSIFSNIYIYR